MACGPGLPSETSDSNQYASSRRSPQYSSTTARPATSSRRVAHSSFAFSTPTTELGGPIHSAFCAEWMGDLKTQPPALGLLQSPGREDTRIAHVKPWVTFPQPHPPPRRAGRNPSKYPPATARNTAAPPRAPQHRNETGISPQCDGHRRAPVLP